MALRDLSRREILQAVAEYDRLAITRPSPRSSKCEDLFVTELRSAFE